MDLEQMLAAQGIAPRGGVPENLPDTYVLLPMHILILC